MFGTGTGTFGVADVYGGASSTRPGYDILGISNPNGGLIAPVTQQASGVSSVASSGTGPAISIVGLVAALILWRLFIEAKERV